MKKEQKAFERGWFKEGADTVFNSVNAFTRGSQFEGTVSGEKLPASESCRNGFGEGKDARRFAGEIMAYKSLGSA